MSEKYRTPLVLGALAVTGVVVVLLFSQGSRGEPIQVVPPTPTAAPSSEIKVYISGAVRAPGVYALKISDRVDDAIKAAGGATAEADLLRINLAARLRDGQQVHVSKVGEEISQAPGSPKETQRVDLNTASLELLDTLPGVGLIRAQRIIESRTQDGPFTDPQQLVERKILPSSVFERIKDRLYVN